MLLTEVFVVELVEEDGLVKFDDVVEELLLQDAKTKAGRMRTQIANKYYLPFTLSPFVYLKIILITHYSYFSLYNNSDEIIVIYDGWRNIVNNII
jgi:hypothetical protein